MEAGNNMHSTDNLCFGLILHRSVSFGCNFFYELLPHRKLEGWFALRFVRFANAPRSFGSQRTRLGHKKLRSFLVHRDAFHENVSIIPRCTLNYQVRHRRHHHHAWKFLSQGRCARFGSGSYFCLALLHFSFIVKRN